jgi:DNA-binding response OmpR family regulator
VRVLVVEDEHKMADLLKRGLEREGYAVDVAESGEQAVWAGNELPYDAVVLDAMIPAPDGFEVCRQWRNAGRWMPVLMLTARGAVDDRVRGLDVGADDYLTKPYDPRELMARVRSLLRRAGSAGHRPVLPLSVGALVLDQVRHTVRVHGRPIDCTPAEFRILEALLAEPGRVLSRRQLLNRAHGDDTFVTERTADTHLKNLRRKIEADPRRPEYLHTVYGVGYKIVYGG